MLISESSFGSSRKMFHWITNFPLHRAEDKVSLQIVALLPTKHAHINGYRSIWNKYQPNWSSSNKHAKIPLRKKETETEREMEDKMLPGIWSAVWGLRLIINSDLIDLARRWISNRAEPRGEEEKKYFTDSRVENWLSIGRWNCNHAAQINFSSQAGQENRFNR